MLPEVQSPDKSGSYGAMISFANLMDNLGLAQIGITAQNCQSGDGYGYKKCIGGPLCFLYIQQ